LRSSRSIRVASIESGDVTGRIRILAQNSGPEILVIDDDELELALICDRLAARGFDVRRARNGAEALVLMEREWFPVIVTDWQMPLMTGVELTQRLRANGVTDTFVIMLTVRDSNFDYAQAYQAGVDDYLTKQTPEIELYSRIHAAFTTVNLRRELREVRAQLARRNPH
jgi:DNA-binding response OmpR family regulator